MGKHGFAAVGLSFLAVAGTLAGARGAVADTTGAAAAAASTPSQLPPAMNLAVASTSASFNACVGPEIGSVAGSTMSQVQNINSMSSSQLLANQGNLMAGQQVSCGNDQLTTSPPDCQQLVSGNAFNAAALGQYQKQAQAAVGAAECKENLFNSLNTELQCMSQQATMLMASIQSAQAAYQQYIQVYQQYVSQLNAVIQDRTDQQTKVQQWLEGDPKLPSQTSLSAAAQNIQGLVNGKIPSEINNFNNQVIQITQTGLNYQQQIENRTMALTYQCFAVNQGPVTYTCPQLPAGKTCTIEEYVLERYYENQFVGSTGSVNQGALIQTQAQGSETALQNLLSYIFSLASTNTTLAPSSQSQAQQIQTTQANQLMTVFTPEDIQAEFGSQLQQFNGHGLDISDFIMQSLNQCYYASYNETLQEKSRPGTVIYNAYVNLQTQEDNTKAAMDQDIDAWAQAYSQAWTALTHGTYNVVPTACQGNSVALADKMVCLQTLQTNLAGLLNGTSANSQVQETIPGEVPGDDIPVSCAGLLGCQSALQNVEQNLTPLIQQENTQKSQYILAANQQVDNLTQSLVNMMSVQSQAMNAKLNQINGALATAGVAPITISPVQGGAPLQKDSNGLYEPPSNVLSFVGGQLRPPMVDLSSTSFSQGLQNVSNAKVQEDQTLANDQGFLTQLNQDQTQCSQMVANNMGQQLGEQIGQFQANCVSTGVICQQSNQNGAFNNFDGLSGLMAAFPNTSSVDTSSLSNVPSVSGYVSGWGCGSVAPGSTAQGQIDNLVSQSANPSQSSCPVGCNFQTNLSACFTKHPDGTTPNTPDGPCGGLYGQYQTALSNRKQSGYNVASCNALAQNLANQAAQVGRAAGGSSGSAQ